MVCTSIHIIWIEDMNNTGKILWKLHPQCTEKESYKQTGMYVFLRHFFENWIAKRKRRTNKKHTHNHTNTQSHTHIYVNKISFAPFSREIISSSYMVSSALLLKINAAKKRWKGTKVKKNLSYKVSIDEISCNCVQFLLKCLCNRLANE